jgi:hypothetical protein
MREHVEHGAAYVLEFLASVQATQDRRSPTRPPTYRLAGRGEKGRHE